MERARLSLSEAAEELGISRLHVLELVADGKIAAERDGHRVLLDAEALRQYRQQHPEGSR